MWPAINIHPTLFIGLGTAGYRIVDHIRQLIFEEFGCGGLPCFRYLVLESNVYERLNHPDDFLGKNPKDHEKIKVVDLSLDDFQGLKARLDFRSPGYHPGIAEWLDEAVFYQSDRTFKCGAALSRQIGRLCLWENWKAVHNEIDCALEDICDVANRERTWRFLEKDYLPRKNGLIEIDKDADLVGSDLYAYVCGTLCGGTCGGAFVDIGYYLGQKMRFSSFDPRGAKPFLLGFFTMADGCSGSGPLESLPLVNSWASLKELDHYTHPGTVYRARYDNQFAIESQGEPYASVYFAGPGNLGGIRLQDDNFKGLNEMTAQAIFQMSLNGIASNQRRCRPSLPCNDRRYFEPNLDQPDVPWSGYMRSFYAFGLSAIRYPRYQVAAGISQRLGEIMSEKYIGETGPAPGKEAMNQTAKNDIPRLLDECEWNLTVTGKPGDIRARRIKQEIQQLLDEGKKEYDNLPPDALKEFIEKFPPRKNEKIRDMLSPPHGSFYKVIVSHLDHASENVLVKNIWRSINEILREKTIQEAIFYVDEIVRLLMEHSAKLPKKEPGYSLKMDFSLGVRVQRDIWARLLLLRESAGLEYKWVKWDQFQCSIENDLKHLVDYFLDQAIQKGLPEIKKIQQQTNQVLTAIRKLKDRCHNSYEELIQYKPPGNMVVVCEDPGEKIENRQNLTKDVEKGAAAILAGPALKELPLINALEKDDAPLNIFGEKDADDLLLLINQHYMKYSMDWVSQFEWKEEHWEKLKCCAGWLIEASRPFVRLHAGRYERLRSMSYNTFYAFGPYEILSPEFFLAKERAHISSQTVRLESVSQHSLVFFQIIPGLCLSDLEIMEMGDRLLDETERKRETAHTLTYFTHRDGERHFNGRHQREKTGFQG